MSTPDQGDAPALPAPLGTPARAAASGSAGRQLQRRLLLEVQAALLPARRMLSRAALVYEERHFREIAVKAVETALLGEIGKVRDEIRALEERIILRVDIVMEELWRRSEGAGARQATELQRLGARLEHLQEHSATQAPELARLARQMADVQRLAAEVSDLRRQAGAPGPLLTALGRPQGGPLVDAYAKYFEGLDPVLDLAPDGGAFEPRAAEAGLSAAVAGVLSGIRAGRLPEDQGEEGIAALLGALHRALQPGGVAVVEVAHSRPPEALTALAEDAGFEVEERLDAAPAGHRLGEVGGDLTDPGLREIAEGINAVVDRLNDFLFAPRSYALVLRRPRDKR